MPDTNARPGYIETLHKQLEDGSFVPVFALDGGSVTIGAEVEIKNDSGSPVPTEPLGVPTVARQLDVTAASASVQLTAGCRRVSIKARGTDMRYVVGVGAQTADASTSHFIESGERLDIAVPAGATIAAIRESASSTNGSLAITELG